jgi:hypothetical protein
MRLTSALVERILSQFEAEIIPESHPSVPDTFFLDSNGLNIVEPAESLEARVQAGKVINLATWNDTDPPGLAPHKPHSTDVVIVLGSKH